MSSKIETPEAMAAGLLKAWGGVSTHAAIRADREQIAARCDEMAAEARLEAKRQADWPIRRNWDGQASAFEAVAAMLRGAR